MYREREREIERVSCILHLCIYRTMLHTPGLHNKIPAHKIFARVWVAQKSFVSLVAAKIFQGLGPKRQESRHGDRVYTKHLPTCPFDNTHKFGRRPSAGLRSEADLSRLAT